MLHVEVLRLSTGIMSWSVKCPKRIRNKSQANIISLTSSEQDEEKVQSAGTKHS